MVCSPDRPEGLKVAAAELTPVPVNVNVPPAGVAVTKEAKLTFPPVWQTVWVAGKFSVAVLITSIKIIPEPVHPPTE